MPLLSRGIFFSDGWPIQARFWLEWGSSIASNSFPQCDLKGLYCAPNTIADAYQSEKYMGNILRYLKCCKLDPFGMPGTFPRYPNLKQVFITSRTYGGYANGIEHGCLMPEPFAYEEGFAVQRSIVAQIDRTTTDYVGDVRYPEKAPWFDWGHISGRAARLSTVRG